jgi:hypothetical protein
MCTGIYFPFTREMLFETQCEGLLYSVGADQRTDRERDALLLFESLIFQIRGSETFRDTGQRMHTAQIRVTSRGSSLF